MIRCEVCGRSADFFIESYDPRKREKVYHRLCELHQSMIEDRIAEAIRELKGR